MSQNIEVITQLVPKNNANLAIADVNHLKGGYIQVETSDEMQDFLKYTNRLKVGMLCYVINESRFYLYNGLKWSIWQMKSGATMELTSVDDIEDLYGTTLETVGQIVFVKNLAGLRWYDGFTWLSFSKIYIQDDEPDDQNGVWIDTREDNINSTEPIVTLLMKMINVLARRVNALEYRNQQLQSGGFDNNMFNLYDEIIGIDPGKEIEGIVDEELADGTTEQQEYDEATLLKNTLLADSPEPLAYKDTLPNVKHLLIKWGSYSDMIKYKDCFLPAELLFCHNTNELYIKHPKTYQLIKIGATMGGGGNVDDPEIDDIMNGIIQSGDYIGSISFVDMVDPSKHFTFSVQNGELDLLCEEELTSPINSALAANWTNSDIQYYSTPYIPGTKTTSGKNPNAMLWLHTVYTAGNKGYSAYNPCNHSFIELVNLNPVDINLNGFYLHYSEGESSSGRRWISLPLKGKIKAYSTYLIKCAKTGADKFARIKVGKPDMYFHKGCTLNANIFDSAANNYSIWNEDGLLYIKETCAFLLTGPCYPTDDSSKKNDAQFTKDKLTASPYVCQNPWLQITEGIGVVYGFCDLVGFGTSMPSILNGPAPQLTNTRLALHYYSMDNVSQAWKGTMLPDGWKTSKLWTTLELANPNEAINLSTYSPKNSKEGKNMFYNKHLITEGAPVIVNCSFGYNPHTTRCFAWVSKGYRDEYLQYKKQGDTEWITVESFKEGDKRSGKGRNWDSSIYNRVRSVTTDGTYFTAHKCIIDLYDWTSDGPETTETYVYRVGCKYNWSDEKTFTLRNRQDIINNGFSFVQTTDQQGFNQEEYEEWRLCAEHIKDYYSGNKAGEPTIDFMINTGDATQNGNRVNEWIDYFNASRAITDCMEQQYTVGNNDLCPTIPYELGSGADTTKVNPINVEYFFTFEHPFEVPVSYNGTHVPSVYSYVYGNTYFLSMNSELSDSGEACAALFGQLSKETQLKMRDWVQRDLSHLTKEPDWKIAYCHESPFTLLIQSVLATYLNALNKNADAVQDHRGDVTSHFNNPGGFWFSEFLEKNSFNLCICGHKHTYTTSRYLCDNPANRMKPFVYDPLGGNSTIINNDNKYFMTVTDDTTQHYVKYTMCLASGFKLTSNKELPGRNIGWLEEYYPGEAVKDDESSVTVNTNQRYPHYIVWNIGKGTETETSATVAERPRIVGRAYKIQSGKSGQTGNNKMFNYNDRVFTYKDIQRLGGNGTTNAGLNKIIVDYLPYTGEGLKYNLTWVGDLENVNLTMESGAYDINTVISYPTSETHDLTFDVHPDKLILDIVITITATRKKATLTWTGDTDKVEGGLTSGEYELDSVIVYPTPKEGYTVQFDKEPSILTEDITINITTTPLPEEPGEEPEDDSEITE